MKVLTLVLFFCPQEKGDSALELLERATRATAPFRAKLLLERSSKRDETVEVLTGTLVVRPGEALSAELRERRRGARPVRTVIREERAIELRAGDRAAKGFDLSRKDNFPPLDLWRRAWAEFREIFEIAIVRIPEEARLPEAVTGPDGKPVEPARAKLRGRARAEAAGGDRAEGTVLLSLVPRDGKLRERISSIRLFLRPEALRIERAVFDSPAQVETYTLSEFVELESVEDSAFDLDLAQVIVEER